MLDQPMAVLFDKFGTVRLEPGTSKNRETPICFLHRRIAEDRDGIITLCIFIPRGEMNAEKADLKDAASELEQFSIKGAIEDTPKSNVAKIAEAVND
jgi:hypothetical protein